MASLNKPRNKYPGIEPIKAALSVWSAVAAVGLSGHGLCVEPAGCAEPSKTPPRFCGVEEYSEDSDDRSRRRLNLLTETVTEHHRAFGVIQNELTKLNVKCEASNAEIRRQPRLSSVIREASQQIETRMNEVHDRKLDEFKASVLEEIRLRRSQNDPEDAAKVGCFCLIWRFLCRPDSRDGF